MTPHDQRQFDLWDGSGLAGLDLGRLPWRGMSPRGLTRVAAGLILKAQAAKSVSEFVDPAQYDLFIPPKKAPWQYQGAPLLVGPNRRDDHG